MTSGTLREIAIYFNNGGPFMWAVLVAFGFGLAVIAERCIYFFAIYRCNSAKLTWQVKNAIMEGKIDEAKKLVSKGSAPIVVMLRNALEHYQQGSSMEKIQDSIEEVSINEVPKMSKRLNYLTLIANITTLLGLLGTITGLQRCFGSLGAVDAAQKAAMLASGIAEALNCTAFGLGVAILSMVMFTTLSNKKQAMLQEIDQSIVRFLNYMKEKVA
ncbi:MAG: MotA/TolQ/ExbB proton channel family protein [Chitinivibrionales bacterium]|nr:MotA/TolQ/ExbB proton channel family protein [Chitinivibrionales bacterium]